MQFLTMNEKQILSNVYKGIKQKHIVISITQGGATNIKLPPNNARVSQLFLKFDDISGIDPNYLFFDESMAKDILEFVNNHINKVSLIIVNCQAGLSRSVAVASALSKIINYVDDAIFTKGIPNMFVYSTILETYFSNEDNRVIYSNIHNRRLQSMAEYLPPQVIKLNNIKEKKVK